MQWKDFSKEDWVRGFMPWQDRVLLNQAQVAECGVQKTKANGVPLSWHLGILGMPGQTAWVGLKGLGAPKVGETVFVSAASGAVGMTVGQIAQQLSCHVVGCAGSDDKVAYVIDELGFDAAFNYKTEPDLDAAFARCCPNGIDINYENVGGDISMAAFNHLNEFGRMLICGLISRYQSSEPQPGPALMNMLVRKLKIQGFIVTDHPELCDEWLEVGSEWAREGKLKYNECIKEGLENAPEALMDVLAGRNFGKQIVKI
jgi:NADPH:quinone reductase